MLQSPSLFSLNPFLLGDDLKEATLPVFFFLRFETAFARPAHGRMLQFSS
jgi:hypothetical protein